MSEIIKSVDTLAAEINGIKEQVKGSVLRGAIEIGRRLIECKKLVPYGDWGQWLQDKVEYSERTAQNMMQLAAEYRDAPDMMNLSYTKAVLLLGVPREERAEFTETHDVEALSTRELKEEIRKLTDEKAKMQVTIDELLNREPEETEDSGEIAKAQADAEQAKKKLAEAEQKAREAEQKAQKAEQNAKDVSAKEKQAQAEADSLKKLMNEEKAKAEKEIRGLKEQLSQAGQPIIQQVTPPDVEKELQMLRAQSQRGQQEMAAKEKFDMLKTIFGQMTETIGQMDKDTAGKYRGAFARALRIMADKLEGKQ